MPRLHAEASPELKRARALLALLPKLDEARWTKALKTLYRSERIEGPRAVSWLLNVLASQAPGGQDRLWLRAQADTAMEDSCQQRRLAKHLAGGLRQPCPLDDAPQAQGEGSQALKWGVFLNGGVPGPNLPKFY